MGATPLCTTLTTCALKNVNRGLTEVLLHGLSRNVLYHPSACSTNMITVSTVTEIMVNHVKVFHSRVLA